MNPISRRILTDSKFELITPDFTLGELYKHKVEIYQKAKVPEDYFNVLINLILTYIEIIPFSDYKDILNEAKRLIKDRQDVPFLALALTKNIPIWSDDEHFQKQSKVKIFKTVDLLRLLRK